MKKIKKLLPLLLAACLLLLPSSCGAEVVPEPEDGVLVYAALNPGTAC